MDILSKSVPGIGNGKCKGPEVGTWLRCLRHSKEVGWSKETERKSWGRDRRSGR